MEVSTPSLPHSDSCLGKVPVRHPLALLSSVAGNMDDDVHTVGPTSR